MSRALALLTLLAVAAPSKPSADPERRPCKEHPEVAAPCFKVRGRLSRDFEFCPFTPDEPGVMRLGCIQSGTNLRVEKREP